MNGEVPCLFKARVPLPVSATDTISYQHISFFPILARALQSKKKDIIFIFERQKKADRDRSSSLSRLLQEQEQCDSPRFRAVYTSPARDRSSLVSSQPSQPGHEPLSWYRGGQVKAHTQRHVPLFHTDVRTSDDQSKFAKKDAQGQGTSSIYSRPWLLLGSQLNQPN